MKELKLPKNLLVDNSAVIDDKIRKGRLKNGLTYYIRHNEEPKGQCNFEIVHKVGSLQEEEHQRGLAHFLEHMAFNGTVHFPGYNSIRGHLDKYGIPSSCINASTNHFRTHYYLRNIPVAKGKDLVDDCLRIVADWSGSLLLEGGCIERERGIVKAEFQRVQSSIMSRLFYRVLDTLSSGNRYSQRPPIGLLPVIESAPHSAIRDFYNTWYVPQNQAVMIVGDIDVDEMEAKVIELLDSDAEPNKQSSPSEFPMETTPEPIFAFASDKELDNSTFMLYSKFPHPFYGQKLAGQCIYSSIMISLIYNMVDSRMIDLLESENSPFVSADYDFAPFLGSHNLYAIQLMCQARKGFEAKAYKAMLLSLLDMRENGFSEQELDLAKKTFRNSHEKHYAERNHIHNSTFSRMCIGNFLDGLPLVSIEKEWPYLNKVIDSITIGSANAAFKAMVPRDGSNLVSVTYSAQAPDGASCITSSEVKKITRDAYSSKFSFRKHIPWLSQLMMEKPQKQQAVWEGCDQRTGAKTLLLPNGVKIHYKVTDFKDDQIKFRIVSQGGTSQFSTADFPNFRVLDSLMTSVGLADLSESSLLKFLSDKSIDYDVFITEARQTIKGSTSSRDLPALMEIIYCLFTNPGRCADDFGNFINRKTDDIACRKNSPHGVLLERLDRLKLVDNSRDHYLSMDEAGRVDFERVRQMYRQLFAGASGFSFYFAGAINEQALKDLAATYLAALPSGSNASMFRPEAIKDEPRRLFHCSDVEMVEPISFSIVMFINHSLPYTLRNYILSDIMQKYFDSRIEKGIRQDAAISYSCGAHIDMHRSPKDAEKMYMTLILSAEVQPEQGIHSSRLINKVVSKIESEGISQRELSQFVAEEKILYDDMMRSNESWIYFMEEWERYGMDMFSDFVSTAESITAAEASQFIRQFMEGSAKQSFVFVPKGVPQAS